MDVERDEVMVILVPIVVYWVYAGMYTLLGSNPRWEKYRVDPKWEENAKNLVSKWAVTRRILAQHAIQVVFSLTTLTLNKDKIRAAKKVEHSPLTIILQFIIAMVVMDTYNYFVHRFMHMNKFLYKNVHYKHHELIVPYAIGALYNTYVEFVLLDTGSAAAAYFLSGMSPRVGMFFFSFAAVKVIDDHCGLLFPGNPLQSLFHNNCAYHNIHHKLYGSKYNFSQPFFVTWDKIFGTYMPYVVQNRKDGGFKVRPSKY